MQINTSIHEVSGLSITEPRRMEKSGCSYQELHATDIHGNHYVVTMYLSNGCEGLRADSVVGLDFNDVAEVAQ